MNDNLIHSKHSNGNNFWYEYDKNNKVIYSKFSDNRESWWKIDKNNKPVRMIEKEIKEYKEIKELEYKRKIEKRSYRFELMDI